METYRNDFGVTALSLQVGENDTERRIVWYMIQERSGARVRYAKSADYDRDGTFTDENSKVVEAKTEIPYGNEKYFSCKARIKELELGEEYVYCVGDGEEFDSDTYRFRIPKNPEKKVCFGIMSDVHFNVYQRKPDDVYYHLKFVNWSEAIRHVRNYGSELPAFIMSIGDNTSVFHMPANRYANPDMKTPEGAAMFNEKEHEEFFHVPFMKSTAFASVLGNHDAQGYDEPSPYAAVSGYHFDMPNDDKKTGHFEHNSHGNFYFTCGQALIIGMNALPHKHGNYHTTPEQHREFILRAIEAHPEAKWRLIFNHLPMHSYVAGADFNAEGKETESSKTRAYYASILKDIDVDVFFSGHQHAFSRTFNILDGEVVDREKLVTEKDENGNVTASIKDPRGILHYNVPAPSNYSFYSGIQENRHEVFANYGVAECAIKLGLENGLEAAKDYRGFIYTQPMYCHAELEETENAYKMTIRCIGVNDDVVRDTYTIEKSK